MVGLPARGKTYISKKLTRYLNWIGVPTKGEPGPQGQVVTLPAVTLLPIPPKSPHIVTRRAAHTLTLRWGLFPLAAL